MCMAAIIGLCVVGVIAIVAIIANVLDSKSRKDREVLQQERLRCLEVGDKFVEVEWGKKYFIVKAISKTGEKVKIEDEQGEEHIMMKNSFKDHYVYGPNYFKYEKYYGTEEDQEISGTPI